MNPYIWQLLEGENDWKAYQNNICEIRNLDPGDMEWGKGPRDYPCLVCCRPVEGREVVTCYVYRSDAQQLLGSTPGTASGAMPAAPPIDDAEKARDVGAGGDSQLAKFFESSTTSGHAHAAAIVRLLIDTGIVSLDQYVRRFEAASAPELKRSSFEETVRALGPPDDRDTGEAGETGETGDDG